MANNEHLQALVRAYCELQDRPEVLASHVDELLYQIEDGIAPNDRSWEPIALQLVLIEALVDDIRRAMVAARVEPHLEWSFDEAMRAAHPELILEDWNEEWKEEDWKKE